MTDENIDKIAKEVVALCEREGNSPELKRLKKLLKDNEKPTENLFKALDAGQLVEDITNCIVKKKAEHADLEKLIEEEGKNYPVLTISQVKFFIERFKNGDVNDIKYRKALVDTFVRKIYLYDDKMTILYNNKTVNLLCP